MTHELVSDGLLITAISGKWEVWCGAEGENIINAHLIGLAFTRAGAIAQAITATQELLMRLRTSQERV